MILEKYVSKEILVTFTITLVALIGIIFLGNTIKETKNIQGIFFSAIIGFLPYIIPEAMVISIPMALLITTTLIYGRLSSDNEITAIRASGISLWKIIYPGLVIGLAFTMVVMYLNLYTVPKARFERKQLKTKATLAFLEFNSAEPGSVNMPGMNLSIAYNSANSGVFEGFSGVVRDNDSKRSENISAPRASLSYDEPAGMLELFLERPMIETVISDQKGSRMQRTTPDSTTYKVPLRIGDSTRRPCEMPYKMLTSYMRDYDGDRYTDAYMMTEKYKRFAQGLSPFFFMLIAIPVGIVTRKSNTAAGLGVSFIIALVVYYPLMMLGEVLGNKGTINPILSVSIANIVILMIAGYFYWKILRQ